MTFLRLCLLIGISALGPNVARAQAPADQQKQLQDALRKALEQQAPPAAPAAPAAPAKPIVPAPAETLPVAPVETKPAMDQAAPKVDTRKADKARREAEAAAKADAKAKAD